MNEYSNSYKHPTGQIYALVQRGKREICAWLGSYGLEAGIVVQYSKLSGLYIRGELLDMADGVLERAEVRGEWWD